MNEATSEVTKAPAKPKTEVTTVKMEDGRSVDFAGKRNMNKSYTVAEDGSEVSWQFDFRNGQSLGMTLAADDPIILELAGHGGLQKCGDEAAGVKDEHGNPDVDSMYLSVESVMTRLANTEAEVRDRWFAERAAGDGFSGASVVLRAIVEASGKSLAEVKAFLEGKLAAGKAAGLTRQKMYQAYRKPGSKTAAIIQRLEAEKAAAGAPGVDPDAELEELQAS